MTAYARSVVAGRVPAGTYHRRAAERHLRDLDRQRGRGFPYVFLPERADRFFAFAQKLKHYKGEWAGRPIVLEPHQLFRLGSLFAWRQYPTGLRRFRTVYFEVPRKNGKSLEAAIVALYGVFFDGEPGAEGYCVATKREQAKIVFNDCKELVRTSDLRARITPLKANLYSEDLAAKLEPLGADRDSTDGLNPQVVILDEAHAMKTRGMIDVMETATGARRQPIVFWITTAGNDPVTPCGDQHDYACKVLDRVLVDDTLLAFIAHAEPDDDPFAEKTWRKANPNYGISVNPADLRALAAKAKHMTGALAVFKQKRLNLWVNASAPWLSPEGWRRGQSTWTAEEMIGRPCWLGIDMSSHIDLTAVVAVFPPEEPVDGVISAIRLSRRWRLLIWCLTPADTLLERAHRDRAPYDLWHQAGFLGISPGNRIDQDQVLEIVRDARARFNVQGIGIDPWNAGNLAKDIEADGFVVTEVPQTLKVMSGPSKDFEADVLDGIVDAGGHPLMTWCVANAVAERDNKDNIYPVKKKSRGRIDPVIAAVIGRKLAGLDTQVAPADDPDLVVA